MLSMETLDPIIFLQHVASFLLQTFNLVGIRLQSFLLGKQFTYQLTSFCLFLVDLLGSVPRVHSSRVNQRCGKTELKDPLSGSFPSGITPFFLW